MKYRETLIALLLAGEDNDLTDWIEAQPLLDQPDILRELKQIVEEKKIDSFGPKELEDFDRFINNYEDKILDEKLSEAQLVMAMEKRDKAMIEIEETVAGVREYVIECIVTNAPNAEPMKNLAQKMIELEKDSNTYNPQNWAAIL